MLGDAVVLLVALAMVAIIPFCFRIARWAEKAGAPATQARASRERGWALLIMSSITLLCGAAAAYFGGTWWLSPLGSIGATVVVGLMFCALAALGAPTAEPKQSPAQRAEPAPSYRRAA